MPNNTLKDTINNLPKTAGVYLFYSGKQIFYIGKAINIKDRVKNHFQQPTYRDNIFISKVTKIEFIKTHSEIEALVLEAQLIKKNLPKFNVIWKDGKNYFFVAISKGEKPTVLIVHQKKDPRAKYIGPFIEGESLKKALKFLRKVFPFYTTEKHPKAKCTWCHLNLCPGPTPDSMEYKKNLKKLAFILEGKKKTAFYGLRKEMTDLAKEHKFEEAGKIRDKMRALQQIMEHTHVIGNEKQKFVSNSLNDEKWNETQKVFQQILGMKTDISKIECYDISNIQGKFAVGSMVVFKNGSADKSQYKKFRIRMKNEPNDIAMLKEVLTRRLLHPEWGYPEIMLIDGGIAQLNVAINAKNALPTTHKIKIISIAKGKRELIIGGAPSYTKASKGAAKIPLKDLPQEIYNVIVALDDEAHRFAITFHRKVRKKALIGIEVDPN